MAAKKALTAGEAARHHAEPALLTRNALQEKNAALATAKSQPAQ
jgi:hypothetical protein